MSTKTETKLTKEKMQERATFELDQLTRDATRTRIHALDFLGKIVEHTDQLKKMIEDPQCKPENLRTDQVTWVQHYSTQFEEHIKEAEKIERIVKDLKHTIQFVKDCEN